MDNKTILLICFALYILGMFAISHYCSRTKSDSRTGEDFLMAGRTVPLFLLVGAAVAGQVGTGASMGATGFGYNFGWAGMLYGFGMALGCWICAKLFAHTRDWGISTFAEEMGVYYDNNKLLRSIVTVAMYLTSVGWVGAHIVGGGMYLAWLTEMDLTTSRIIVGVIVALFVFKDGYEGVTWIATAQAVILFFGFIILAIFALKSVGGFEGLKAAAPEGAYTFLGLGKLSVVYAISIVLADVMTILAVPSYRQRIYSSSSVRTARIGSYLTGAVAALFCLIPPILGMAAYAHNPDLTQSNFAFPYLAMTVLPLWLGALALISGLSATMSSAASDAAAAMTIMVNDVHQMVKGGRPQEEKVIVLSKYAVVLTVALALIGSLTAEDILTYITSMIGLLITGQAVAAVMGLLWPRATWQGGLAAIFGGAFGALCFQYIPFLNELFGYAVFPALIASTVSGVAVSLITPKKRFSQEEALLQIQQERAVVEAAE